MDYTTELFEENKKGTLCFPGEQYSYDELKKEHFFIGAYDKNQCIGLAIFKKGFFKYMYLYDLKVNSNYRQQGIATQLIKKGLSLALNQGDKGIYTQWQDNNLSACLFYLKCVFVIGGLDTKVYQRTPQEYKKDIYFYLNV
ncbi:hypothetical protein G314FT_02760 [Vagococcus luciliae]|uniref:N-acetyltransferase domain-containing protein n=1 Tax=Vagococcus luciliae TaxID=2920380 RepID=A0ABY5NX16_9ENTE|nr:hypothetical protein G314FT_02760 [Vagococcus luciliae]